MSKSAELRRRYTIVMDLWRAPGEDIENLEGAESPDPMELVDEARFNLETASRANEAAYWLSQRGWVYYGSYDALVFDRSGLTREDLARHLLQAGLQKQVVEEYDDPESHRPSRLVHLDPETLSIQEWPERQSLDHDSEHCPLCLKGEVPPPSPPEPDSVLQEAEMILAAARFKDAVRRAGLRLPEVLALFFGYSQVRQLSQEEVYPLIEQYREYRQDLERRGMIEE
ncbi:MAG: hypothetical protein ACM3US_03995 [Sphingomonadaceae bacterium]